MIDQSEIDRVAWEATHAGAALAEGWSIFFCDGGDNQWQVQRIDDPNETAEYLNDDEVAWLIVANGTGAHHLATLEFLRAHCPLEYDLILTYKENPT